MKILNFGSINMDYIYEMDEFVTKGKTVNSRNLSVLLGGKGLNQSVALAATGVQNIHHAGAIGQDREGVILNFLEERNINTEKIEVISSETGHAIIQVDTHGDNCIITYGGANHEITKEFVDDVLAEFEKGDFIVLQNEINKLNYIIEEAAKKGLVIFLNPSPINDKVDQIQMSLINYLLVNETEANYFCPNLSGEELAKGLAERIRGVKIILTLGENGMIFFDGENIIKQPIYNVKAVDTTGAGDTFTGYFIGLLAKGLSIHEILSLSAKASAITVSRKGAAKAIPLIKEVREANIEMKQI